MTVALLFAILYGRMDGLRCRDKWREVKFDTHRYHLHFFVPTSSFFCRVELSFMCMCGVVQCRVNSNGGKRKKRGKKTESFGSAHSAGGVVCG